MRDTVVRTRAMRVREAYRSDELWNEWKSESIMKSGSARFCRHEAPRDCVRGVFAVWDRSLAWATSSTANVCFELFFVTKIGAKSLHNKWT